MSLKKRIAELEKITASPSIVTFVTRYAGRDGSIASTSCRTTVVAGDRWENMESLPGQDEEAFELRVEDLCMKRFGCVPDSRLEART